MAKWLEFRARFPANFHGYVHVRNGEGCAEDTREVNRSLKTEFKRGYQTGMPGSACHISYQMNGAERLWSYSSGLESSELWIHDSSDL